MVLGSTNSNGRDKEMAEQPVQTRSHSDTEERHQEKGLPIATSPCPSEQMDSTDTADGTPKESTSPKPLRSAKWVPYLRPRNRQNSEAALPAVTKAAGRSLPPKEGSKYMKSGKTCRCSHGWFCHLFDETEEERKHRRAQKYRIPHRCTWRLLKEPRTPQTTEVPLLQVTTPEGKIFYPEDPANYTERRFWRQRCPTS